MFKAHTKIVATKNKYGAFAKVFFFHFVRVLRGKTAQKIEYCTELKILLNSAANFISQTLEV